jgi:AcrR family transcriptional regulator
MKRTKQITESKELIFEGYMKLLNVKEEDDITLTEIAQTAGVGRMTLYRHFKEKEDILLYKVELSYEKARIYLKSDHLSLIDLLNFRFKLFKESPHIDLLYKMNRLQRLFDKFREIYSQDINKVIPKSNDAFERVFIMAGLDAMTHLWIETGMKESSHEMAKKALHIIQKYTDWNQ